MKEIRNFDICLVGRNLRVCGVNDLIAFVISVICKVFREI